MFGVLSIAFYPLDRIRLVKNLDETMKTVRDDENARLQLELALFI